MLGVGWPELLVIGLVGFFIFGPERLPTLARDAARMIKQLRAMADGASAELRAQLPSASEFGLDEVRSLRDLHPKTMVTRALFDSDTAPDLLGGMRGPVSGRKIAAGAMAAAGVAATTTAAAATTATPAAAGETPSAAAPSSAKTAYAAPTRTVGAPPPYDLDAT